MTSCYKDCDSIVGARLKILQEPQPIYSFLYESEVRKDHAYLYADPAADKNWIHVQLKHWRGEEEVSVRCSLVSDSPERKPHFHRLAKKIGSQIQINEYQEGEVLKMNDCLIAKFPKLSIVRTKIPNNGDREVIKMWQMRDIVRLKFEAFFLVNGNAQQEICNPVYSQPIHPPVIYSSIQNSL
ncbi:uncharacterized protein LOC116920451 isoform X2 [Daphnia magna]|uniref:uncharacterized protein LOC116920451 isoform X2 n=1 Tax=Daphnia magna TaxID=35525 RepID=UPI001E1BBC7D|nr:uncharacterized protein LOC116920451 isoform X2 [Daphnia magna]